MMNTGVSTGGCDLLFKMKTSIGATSRIHSLAVQNIRTDHASI